MVGRSLIFAIGSVERWAFRVFEETGVELYLSFGHQVRFVRPSDGERRMRWPADKDGPPLGRGDESPPKVRVPHLKTGFGFPAIVPPKILRLEKALMRVASVGENDDFALVVRPLPANEVQAV
jgi:hypothetical protein